MSSQVQDYYFSHVKGRGAKKAIVELVEEMDRQTPSPEPAKRKLPESEESDDQGAKRPRVEEVTYLSKKYIFRWQEMLFEAFCFSEEIIFFCLIQAIAAESMEIEEEEQLPPPPYAEVKARWIKFEFGA